MTENTADEAATPPYLERRPSASNANDHFHRGASLSIATLDGSLHRGCGGRYAMQIEAVTMRFSGMATDVQREFFRCEKCGHESRTIDQREAAEKTAIDQIRINNRLLSPKAIRQLRDGLGLTTAQFSELCYGTPKGIVEGWERGRYLQNREADALLRSFTDSETLERRAAKAGVTLAPKPDAPPADLPADDALPMTASQSVPAPSESE